MLRKCYQRRLIPVMLTRTGPTNKVKYHGLAVRVNSGDDGATSYKNLVNFCLVSPEMKGLICLRLVRHGQKLAYIVEYLRMYWTDFRNIFTIWNALCADDGSIPFFQFVKGRCHGNQIMLRNEGKLILRAFFARLPDGSTVLFRYYLLGGDTAAPSRLFTRLYHTFVV